MTGGRVFVNLFPGCQRCLSHPFRVDIFGSTFIIAPLAIINGVRVLLLNRYRPQNYIGWSLIIVGMGLLSTLKAGTAGRINTGFQIVDGAGMGILFTSTTFPILASVLRLMHWRPSLLCDPSLRLDVLVA